MKLKVEHLSEIVVMSVTKELVGEESEDLVTVVQQILEDGTRQFVVDLSEHGSIDSDSLASLIKAYTVAAKQSGRFVVVLPNNFTRLTGIVHPIPVFELYPSRDEAIGALLHPAPVLDRMDAEAGRSTSGCLGSACAVFLISAAMLVAVWLT